MIGKSYTTIDDVLISRIIVYIHCYATESGHFGGKFGEAVIVLAIV